jgi:RND family efflux transporter MFP subunit
MIERTFRSVAPVGAIALATAALAAAGCDNKSETASAKAPPPASSSRVVKEADLNVMTLTPEAERRLDVQTAPVEKKKVPRARVLGGEVVVPPGRTVLVSAPVAGTVRAAGDGPVPAPGGAVRKGQSVLTLVPLLTNEARTTLATSLVDAEGQVRSAEVQVGAAEVALARAKQLLAENAGTRRSLDDAQAQFDLARKTLDAAAARRESLAKAAEGSGTVEPLNVTSPESGVLRNVQAAPGQMVAAGAPLFEVINASVVWVRVPVYAGDADDVARDQPAAVSPLGGGRPSAGANGGDAPQSARPVAAPPSADPLGSTVDLFYELDNARGALRPSERVRVTVPLREDEESLVVPWSAVTFDVHGGAWVYVKVGEHQYARSRVEVRHVTGPLAVLVSGPAAGAAVVTQGVAEMYGSETGFAK